MCQFVAVIISNNNLFILYCLTLPTAPLAAYPSAFQRTQYIITSDSFWHFLCLQHYVCGFSVTPWMKSFEDIAAMINQDGGVPMVAVFRRIMADDRCNMSRDLKRFGENRGSNN